MKSFWDNVDFIDVVLAGMGIIVLVFMLLMWYQGRTPDAYVLEIFGSIFLLLFGKQLPTAASTSALKLALGKPIAILSQSTPQQGYTTEDQVLPKSTKTCEGTGAGHASLKQ